MSFPLAVCSFRPGSDTWLVYSAFAAFLRPLQFSFRLCKLLSLLAESAKRFAACYPWDMELHLSGHLLLPPSSLCLWLNLGSSAVQCVQLCKDP